MKKLAFTLLLSTLFVSARAQTLSTANEVLNKYFNALGGKKALMKIKDITLYSGTNSGGSYPLTIKYKLPFKTLIVAADSTGKVVYRQIIDGKQISTRAGDKVFPNDPATIDRGIVTAQLMPELYLSEKGVKSTFSGTETINGKEAYKLTHTMPDGSSTWATYYDTQTGLKVQLVVAGQNGPVATNYSDYREVNGIKLPHRFRGPGYDIEAKVFQINKGLSDAEFNVQ